MSKLKIQGKEIRALGYPEGPVISVAMNVMEKNFKHHSKEKAFDILKEVLQSPHDYASDEILGLIAKQLLPKPEAEGQNISLNSSGIQFNVFGQEHIEEGAMHQMYQAAKLPISVAGALMPDAHSGYGLPIGGVLATDNAVIPYGVGVDIGCRMSLSIFDLPASFIKGKDHQLQAILKEHTKFGMNETHANKADHEVFSRSEFQDIPLLKGLLSKAYKQLGTSGGGNHFVEFGTVQLDTVLPEWKLEPGNYFCVLSHSGSRG